MKTIEELREYTKDFNELIAKHYNGYNGDVIDKFDYKIQEISNALDELEQYRNNPQLTWEQVKEMQGEPIYHSERKEWFLVGTVFKGIIVSLINFFGEEKILNESDFEKEKFFAKEVKEDEEV